MDELYSVEFFLSFIESLQRHCQQFLNFSQFVEVSGYVCVEIDNIKKERYVLSELLQSSGNVVSESYCTKAFSTSESNWMAAQSPLSYQSSGNDLATQIYNHDNESRIHSKQRKAVSRQSVFPRRSRSENQSMILPVNPVVQQVQTPNLPEGKAFVSQSSDIQPRSVEHSFSIGQFNIQKPFPVKTEGFSGDISASEPQTVSVASKAKKRKHSSHKESTSLQSPTSTSNMSYNSESEDGFEVVVMNPAPQSSSEIQVTLPRTLSDEGGQTDTAASNPSSAEGPEVIDLDMFHDDEFDNMPSESSFLEQSFSDLPSSSLDTSNWIKQGSKKVANPGSLSVLRSVVKRFKMYHFEKSGQDIDLLDTEPEQLNEMLLDFFTGAKKMDGSDLTVGSLKNTQVYIERYLKQNGYPYSITKDDRFKSSRDYIKTRQEEGCKSKQVTKHIPVNDYDIEIMFQKNVLGGSSPDALFNTLWLLNAKYFAKKKPGEHFNMKWGDIQLKTNDAGQEYLERPIHDAFSLKLFAKPHNPSRCFVNFYKQYRDLRPKGTHDQDFAFYLKLNKNPGPGLWFLPEPIMWSPFTYVWKKIVASSGLSINKRLL